MEEKGFPLLKLMTIFYDNQSCIKMAKNIVLHARTQHIKKARHFIHDQIKKGMIILEHVRSKD